MKYGSTEFFSTASTRPMKVTPAFQYENSFITIYSKRRHSLPTVLWNNCQVELVVKLTSTRDYKCSLNFVVATLA